jgi:hypothetical protein
MLQFRSARPLGATGVSGSSKTKTYGKGTAVREREENRTLPRIRLFGKDTDKIFRLFKEL